MVMTKTTVVVVVVGPKTRMTRSRIDHHLLHYHPLTIPWTSWFELFVVTRILVT